VNLLAERRPVGCNSLSSTKPLKRRRLLCSLVIGGRLAVSFLELRRLLIPASVSGRRAVFSFLLVTLVDRWPIDVLALASTFSSSRRDAFGEAVLLRCGFWLPLLLELGSWRAGGPKWFVPGDGRDVSPSTQRLGPNRNHNFYFRVLLVISRDWSVFSFLLSPYLNFVPPLLLNQ
jgi:hypothetical protein